MTAILRRTKAFIHEGHTHTAPVSPVPQQLPEWVQHSATFKQGVADGSIIWMDRPKAPEQVQLSEEPTVLTDPKPKATEPTAAPEPPLSKRERRRLAQQQAQGEKPASAGIMDLPEVEGTFCDPDKESQSEGQETAQK
jgi:hypothetical protein